MSNVQSLSVAHNATVAASESAYQAVLQTPNVTAAAVKTAVALHYNNCLKSAITNGIQPGQYITALKENHSLGYA